MKRLALALLLMIATSCVLAQNSVNISGVILPSAVRTAATVTSADQVNAQWKGAVFFTNVSAFTGGTYTLNVEGKDPVSGSYYTIASSAALGGTGLSAIRIYPGLAATTTSVNDFLPKNWRVRLAGAAANMTISVGMSLLP